jgi:hypothetical protein
MDSQRNNPDVNYPGADSLYTNGNGKPNFEGRYWKDGYGIIHQLDPAPFTYDEKYSAIYDREEYARESHVLMSMRLGFIVGAIKRTPASLLDYGYGNGAFLKMARRLVPMVTGYDITGVQLDGIKTIDGREGVKPVPADVYTLWDVIEHVPELELVYNLPCNYLVLSTPYCHQDSMGEEWFLNNYRHLKPNEHLHHFTPKSLERFMHFAGYKLLANGFYEDVVRKGPDVGLVNIFSQVYERNEPY